MRVIDILEAIQVKEHHRKGPMVALGQGNCMRQPVIK